MKNGIFLLLLFFSGMHLSDCCNILLTGKVDGPSRVFSSEFQINDSQAEKCHCDFSCFGDFFFFFAPKFVYVYTAFVIIFEESIEFVKYIFPDLLLPPPNI